MEKNKSASVFGASGLVGSFLVELLSQDNSYSDILVANRTHIDYTSPKIKEVLLDFDSLDKNPELFKVDELFVCIGTTIHKAGSKERFRQIDLKLPTKIATYAKEYDLQFFCMISSLGADSSSSNFYSKTKGQAEDAIKALDLTNCYFVRPSLLIGDREEKRVFEEIAQWWMKKLSFLFVGGLKKYKGIKARDVAAAMIYLAEHRPQQKVISSNELQQFSSNYFEKR